MKPKTLTEIEVSIKRLKDTYSLLNVSHAKQIRIMVGDYSPLVVCDSIYPTSEIKKEYLRRIKYRIIELQSEVMSMKSESLLSV
jgi:hypothetical protein